MAAITTADGPPEGILSWKRTTAIRLREGKIMREPDGILTNAEINKKMTTNNRTEFIAWITEEELEALETNEATSKLETIIDLQTRRGNTKRRTKAQRRDLDNRLNNESHQAKLPIGLPQGGWSGPRPGGLTLRLRDSWRTEVRGWSSLALGGVG
jgi:hypothetical protein